jgi:hypothetical protein
MCKIGERMTCPAASSTLGLEEASLRGFPQRLLEWKMDGVQKILCVRLKPCSFHECFF